MRRLMMTTAVAAALAAGLAAAQTATGPAEAPAITMPDGFTAVPDMVLTTADLRALVHAVIAAFDAPGPTLIRARAGRFG